MTNPQLVRDAMVTAPFSLSASATAREAAEALSRDAVRAVLVFTGRKRVPGIQPGRAIIAEGVARDEHSRLTILNPRYSLHE